MHPLAWPQPQHHSHNTAAAAAKKATPHEPGFEELFNQLEQERVEGN